MPVLRPVRSAPPAAARLAAILRRIAGGGLADPPVDVELWDGSVLPAGAPGGSAGRILLDEPNQLGLSRAYVAGELGFDGDLSALLAERVRFASVRPSARDLALATAAAVLTAGPDVLRRPPVPTASRASSPSPLAIGRSSSATSSPTGSCRPSPTSSAPSRPRASRPATSSRSASTTR